MNVESPPPIDRDLNAPVAPWSYNPAAWSQRIPICVLAMVAAAISGYMAAFQWKLVDTVWDPFFGEQTELVLTSKVAEWIHHLVGVPDAALGALAYLGDAIFGLAGSTRRWQYRPWMVILFGIDVIPLGIVSAVLVILQGTVVGKWCFLCLVTAGISLILVYMAYDEVRSSLGFLYRVQRRAGWRETWMVCWGWPSDTAEVVAAEMIRQAKRCE